MGFSCTLTFSRSQEKLIIVVSAVRVNLFLYICAGEWESYSGKKLSDTLKIFQGIKNLDPTSMIHFYSYFVINTAKFFVVSDKCCQLYCLSAGLTSVFLSKLLVGLSSQLLSYAAIGKLSLKLSSRETHFE